MGVPENRQIFGVQNPSPTMLIVYFSQKCECIFDIKVFGSTFFQKGGTFLKKNRLIFQ